MIVNPNFRFCSRVSARRIRGSTARDMKFEGFKIKTLEQGGEYPDTMPQAIEVTDAEGRKALYVPLSRYGETGRSAGILDLLTHRATDP